MHPCVHLCVRCVCPLLARMVWSFQGCVRAFIISYVFSLLLFIFCVPLLMRVGYLCARLNCFYVYLSMVRVRVSMIFKCAPSPLSLNLSVPHLRLSLLVFVCHQPSSLHFFFFVTLTRVKLREVIMDEGPVPDGWTTPEAT